MEDIMLNYHKVSLKSSAYERLKTYAEDNGLDLSTAVESLADQAERFNRLAIAKNVRYVESPSDPEDEAIFGPPIKKSRTYIDGRTFPWYTKAGVEKVTPKFPEGHDFYGERRDIGMYEVSLSIIVSGPVEFVDQDGVTRRVTNYPSSSDEVTDDSSN